MKKYITTLLLILSTLILSGQRLDSAYFLSQYELSFVNDLERPGRVGSEIMQLLVGKSYRLFESYTAIIEDSLKNSNPAVYRVRKVEVDGTMTIYPPQKEVNRSRHRERYIISLADDQLICSAIMFGFHFYQYKELLPKPQWRIDPISKSILGYKCQQAKTSYKGREWTVWFTSEIPISEGPWLLRGLPGLILYAEDSDHHYTFKCIAIEKVAGKKKIEKDSDETYSLIAKKDFLLLQRRFFENPLGMLGGDFDIGNEGKPKRTYNPIERTD